MHSVQTNAELEAFHIAGVGFVFNDFTSGPSSARDNVLHAASCTWVGRMLDGAEPQSRPSVRKVFFDTLDEAHSWLMLNRGPEGRSWKRCATCRLGRDVVGSRPNLRLSRPSATVREAKGGTGTTLRAVQGPIPGSWPRHASFAMPDSQPLQLPVPPRLASWNKADDPDQLRLAEYLAAADELLRPHYQRLSGPLALRLDVGLPQAADLLDQRDLDNYLYPLAARVSRGITGVLACAWGTKQHSASSFVRIEQAVPAPVKPPFDRCYTVRTNASSQSAVFKEQIRDQLSTATPAPPGPVRMQLSFTIGPGRNWMNLWKQTIDALGQILGHSPTAATWAPMDGRIVDLGLHRRVDPAMGNDVLIVIAAQRTKT
jgi:hypothetical protein